MSRNINRLGADIRKLAANLKRIEQSELLTIIGVEAVRGARRNFEVEGIIRNGSIDKWKPKKKNPRNKKTLTDRGNLKAAVRYWIANGTVTVGVDGQQIPYAQIHQTGGGIPRKNGSTTQMPQRKYLELTPDIVTAINRKVEQRLNRLKP
jgi:phage virion morphogenesis protein